MAELPASVRLSLWVTRAWATGAPLEKAIRLAMPDIDHVAGDLAQLGLWRDLGEQALLVALPSPGDLSRMPGAPAEAHAAAAAGGECVYVPGLGGLLVPSVSWFGSGDSEGPDVGTRVDWTAYEADPVPRHRVEALDASQLERHLRDQLRVATLELDALGGQPFGAAAARDLADTALGGTWGLPDGMPGRATRVITMAGTVARVVDVALEAGDGALTALESARRQTILRRLQRDADHALSDATNAACAVLAGWRPA
jgi:hypothetical protein